MTRPSNISREVFALMTPEEILKLQEGGDKDKPEEAGEKADAEENS